MNARELSDMEILRGIGQRFKSYRKSCGISQEELAKRTGISIATIRNFERQVSSNITVLTLTALMRGIDQLEQIENLLPELPPNPEAIYRKQMKRKR